MSTITLAEPTITDGLRELDSRRLCGVSVSLLWDETDGQLWVSVTDAADPTRGFAVAVSADDARFAFEHPFLFEPARAGGLLEWADTIDNDDNDEEN